MIEALHISETGLKANQDWLDHLSNNIANMHSAGFKKSNVNFIDIVSNTNQTSSAELGPNQSTGLGSKLSRPQLDLTMGSLKSTARELDIAINGSGLLEVILPNGNFGYTRLGSLSVDQNGFLGVAGNPLSAEIQVPLDVNSFSITKKGEVFGQFDNGDPAVLLGEIQLVMPSNPSALNSIGNSTYTLSQSQSDLLINPPGAGGNGEILQGFLEMSNVSLVDEMTNLVLAQRAYQLNARLIQTADQLLETVNNLRR